jgi:hypothetical protein
MPDSGIDAEVAEAQCTPKKHKTGPLREFEYPSIFRWILLYEALRTIANANEYKKRAHAMHEPLFRTLRVLSYYRLDSSSRIFNCFDF